MRVHEFSGKLVLAAMYLRQSWIYGRSYAAALTQVPTAHVGNLARRNRHAANDKIFPMSVPVS
jgi:hypothetical protein